MTSRPRTSVAVVVPAYRVAQQILGVIRSIPAFVDHVVVVDDDCPENSAEVIKQSIVDKRLIVLEHETNQGVGGAVTTGYRWILDNTSADIIVKLDGDGQMDPSQIERLIEPLVRKEADYAKGDRFDSLEDLEAMPRIRIFGNAVLSIFSKFSTGYWDITDPTNGFTAIATPVLRRIKLEKLRKSYFFESDMLFRLSIIRAVVVDVSMPASYGTEKSNLNIRKVILEFPSRYFINFSKRIFYNYYLREWNVASFELPTGLLLLNWGSSFGFISWWTASSEGVSASSGQVMLSAVPVILGFQLLLAFVNYDVASVPKRPRQLG